MEVKELLQKGFWTLLARSLGAGLLFLMTILFARWLGASDFGLFSLGLTVMTLFGVLARWGTDQVLLKQVGAYWETEPEIAKGYAVSALKIVLLISTVLALFIALFHDFIASSIFNKDIFSGVLFYFGLLIIPFALNYTLGEVYKGTGRPILSTYLQNVIPAFVTVIASLVVFNFYDFSLITAIESFSLGVLLAFIISAFLWQKIIPSVKSSNISLKMIVRESWPMLLITSGSLLMAWSDMIVLGILSTPEDLGIYSAASRTVLITSLILNAINSITAPKYARLYKKGDLQGLARLAQNSSKILILLVFLPTFILLFFSEYIMGLFGSEFVVGATILITLSIGQFIHVSCGSVGYILSMTGHEKLFRNVILVSAAINIILSTLLVQLYGSLGVAMATAFSLSLWNILALYLIRKKLGFWPLYLITYKK